MIDFLTQFIVALLPFAMLVAVTALILLIDKYSGFAVRNVAGGGGDGGDCFGFTRTVGLASKAAAGAGK